MGQIIRRDAAAEDILHDAETTLTKAQARGGRFQELAEQRLSQSLALYTTVKSQHATALSVLAPVLAAKETRNEIADRTIGRVFDVIWNEVGRPAYDAALAVIFPDGIAYYAEGDTSEQPERMDILEKLLEAGIHPKLSKDTATACAAEIKAESIALRAAVDAARKPTAEVKVLGRVRTALAKVVHAELSNLKRHYKIEGFTEAEIHSVIPDRPTKTAKKEGEGKDG